MSTLRFPLLVLSLLITLPAIAAGADAGYPAGRGLEVQFPGASRQLVEQALAHPPEIDGDEPARVARLEASDDRFTLPLRQSLIPCLAGECRPTCSPQPEPFSQLLQQLATEVEFLDHDKVAGLVARAHLALLCSDHVLPDAQVSRLFFLEGVDLVNRQLDGSRQLETALSIWPDLPLPADYSAAIRDSFVQAKKQLAARPSIRVETLKDLAGLELRIDGAGSERRRSSLLAGRHFLQLVAKDGRVITGSEVELEPPPAGHTLTLPPPALSPPSTSDLLERLENELRKGRLSAPVDKGLAGFMGRERLSWILFIVPGNAVRPPLAGWLTSQGGLKVAQLELPVSPPRGTARARVGLRVSVGLGVGALISGAVYGVSAYRVLASDEFASDLPGARRVSRIGDVAGITSLILLTSAGVTATLTWLW